MSCKRTSCIKGYTGLLCDKKCPFPTFGKECQSTCSCGFETCDHIYGCIAERECQDGYFGPNCRKICPYPTFGKDCQLECNCSKTLCSPRLGCKDKFLISIKSTPECLTFEQSVSTETLFVKSTSTSRVITSDGHFTITIILIFTSSAVFVALVCSVVFCCTKNRRHGSQQESQISADGDFGSKQNVGTSKEVPNEKRYTLRENLTTHSKNVENENLSHLQEQELYLTPQFERDTDDGHNQNEIYLTVL
ncbi:uncharacterized protein LOC130052595 [Ostrea edulis]|uniref:uncharacterized protein LOC130052595 n=1 Tax=Ostrea edulis TaxID=37623 RepID=UPI0020960D50|nr:uncharacterized protein LOC130052595 [Ostrea edulis]